jgi:hypothetical protein
MVEIGLGGHLELSIKRLGKIDYRRDKISMIKDILPDLIYYKSL